MVFCGEAEFAVIFAGILTEIVDIREAESQAAWDAIKVLFPEEERRWLEEVHRLVVVRGFIDQGRSVRRGYSPACG